MVSFKSIGNTVRVPVRVCSLSARVIEIPPRSLLRSLTRVLVVDTWTPDPSKKESDIFKDIPLEEVGVSIDADNLSAEKLLKVR